MKTSGDKRLQCFILLVFWSFIFLYSNLFFFLFFFTPWAGEILLTKPSSQSNHQQSPMITWPVLPDWAASTVQEGQLPWTRDQEHTGRTLFSLLTLSCLACWCLLKSHKNFESLCLLTYCWKAKGELFCHLCVNRTSLCSSYFLEASLSSSFHNHRPCFVSSIYFVLW